MNGRLRKHFAAACHILPIHLVMGFENDAAERNDHDAETEPICRRGCADARLA
jgi:hypothetical protein